MDKSGGECGLVNDVEMVLLQELSIDDVQGSKGYWKFAGDEPEASDLDAEEGCTGMHKEAMDRMREDYINVDIETPSTVATN